MISLDYRDKRPLYEQVYYKLSELISRGVIKDGDKLPSVRSLALNLAINPNTIQRAYQSLENDGYIYSIKGVGNFVSNKKYWYDNNKFNLFQKIDQSLEDALNSSLSEEEIMKHIEKFFLERRDKK